MKNIDAMTEQDVRDYLAAEALRKERQREANKLRRETHPETPEQKLKRTLYNKKRQAERKEFRAAMLAKARALGLA
jgi:hypothetical protein